MFVMLFSNSYYALQYLHIYLVALEVLCIFNQTVLVHLVARSIFRYLMFPP